MPDELRLFFTLFALIVGYCGVTWVVNLPAYRYRRKICADRHARIDWLLSPLLLLLKITFFVFLGLLSPLVILVAVPLLPFLFIFRKVSLWVNRLLEALTNPEKYMLFFERMIRLGLWIQFIPDDTFTKQLDYLKRRSKFRPR